jgi:hypothetical protein
VTPKEREPFLVALDAVLLPLVFKRRKSSFEWTRRVGASDVEWVHLNFGMGTINPTFGVIYRDLSKILPPEAGPHYSVAETLYSKNRQSYSLNTAPSALAAAICANALPRLPLLRDRDLVLYRLANESGDDWPTFGASNRMRLMPLLLAQSGRVSDALERLSIFEQRFAHLDQQIPTLAQYAAYFRARYTA